MGLRIAFLVNRDIDSNLALNLLLPELHQRTVGIFLSEDVWELLTRFSPEGWNYSMHALAGGNIGIWSVRVAAG